MALELIRSERVIEAVKPGMQRLTDGGGLYLLVAQDKNAQHGWRFDYTFEMKRKTISLGARPQRTGEQPVRTSYGNWPDLIFDVVVVHGQASVIGEACQRRPALQAVVQCPGGGLRLLRKSRGRACPSVPRRLEGQFDL